VTLLSRSDPVTTNCAERAAPVPPADAALALSVVCPFFNERAILPEAVRILRNRLEQFRESWELILINDGSTDGGETLLAPQLAGDARVRLLGYPHNRGRGYALRQGIAAARGDVIVTTEIDLSWGEDVVDRLYAAIQAQPEADIVVASPHLPGGGYRNVPAHRVFLSRFGNRIIRACTTNAVTMNTGMTRAYRRAAIQNLPLEEDRKEFHLEVIMKAEALRLRIVEIPCVLEWKAHKLGADGAKRKSASKVKKLMVSHTAFSLFANPVRHVWAVSAATMLLAIAFLLWGVYRLFTGQVSVYELIISLSLAMFSVMFFYFGLLARQGWMIQRELWTLKQDLAARRPAEPRDKP
jgi:glycosyltransferase involved in cell wall biosynthesis